MQKDFFDKRNFLFSSFRTILWFKTNKLILQYIQKAFMKFELQLFHHPIYSFYCQKWNIVFMERFIFNKEKNSEENPKYLNRNYKQKGQSLNPRRLEKSVKLLRNEVDYSYYSNLFCRPSVTNLNRTNSLNSLLGDVELKSPVKNNTNLKGQFNEGK